MITDTAQLQILKAAIDVETDAEFVALRNSGATGAMAAWYNVDSSTDAWMTNAIGRVIDEGANYSTFDTILAGKRDAWAIFLQYAPRDFSKNKNRKVVTDVWGNATASSVAESILQACVEKASRGELVFGSTNATTGTVTAVKRNWIGDITNTDIINALAS